MEIKSYLALHSGHLLKLAGYKWYNEINCKLAKEMQHASTHLTEENSLLKDLANEEAIKTTPS